MGAGSRQGELLFEEGDERFFVELRWAGGSSVWGGGVLRVGLMELSRTELMAVLRS
jgi:hypothetical protein